MADVATWARWFLARIAWRSILAGLSYFLLPLLLPYGLQPGDLATLRGAIVGLIVADVLRHERATPKQLFSIRRRDR